MPSSWKRFKRDSYNYAKKHTTAENAKKALRLALMTKALINVEYKHIDTAPLTVNPDNAGTVLAMNACAQGDTSSTRDGLSVRNKSIYIRYTVAEHASASLTHVRAILFRAREPQGTTPSVTDVLESANTLALMNNVNTTRYKVLWSRDWTLSSGSSEFSHGDKYIKVNFHTKYKSSAGSAGDINANGIYLLLISNQATNTPSFNYSARVRFIDN